MSSLEAGNWEKYIRSLHDWADEHSSPEFYGMSPPCFDEFMDCDLAEMEGSA